MEKIRLDVLMERTEMCFSLVWRLPTNTPVIKKQPQLSSDVWVVWMDHLKDNGLVYGVVRY